MPTPAKIDTTQRTPPRHYPITRFATPPLSSTKSCGYVQKSAPRCRLQLRVRIPTARRRQGRSARICRFCHNAGRTSGRRSFDSLWRHGGGLSLPLLCVFLSTLDRGGQAVDLVHLAGARRFVHALPATAVSRRALRGAFHDLRAPARPRHRPLPSACVLSAPPWAATQTATARRSSILTCGLCRVSPFYKEAFTRGVTRKTGWGRQLQPPSGGQSDNPAPSSGRLLAIASPGSRFSPASQSGLAFPRLRCRGGGAESISGAVELISSTSPAHGSAACPKAQLVPDAHHRTSSLADGVKPPSSTGLEVRQGARTSCPPRGDARRDQHRPTAASQYFKMPVFSRWPAARSSARCLPRGLVPA